MSLILLAVLIRFLTLISLVSLNFGLIFGHAPNLCVSVYMLLQQGIWKGVEEGKKEVYPNGGMHDMFSCILFVSENRMFS